MGKVFISYSHRDEEWKDRVVEQLGVLADEGLTIWDDRRISAGADWLPEIEVAIDGCDVALLLISTKFLNSKFCKEREVPALLARRQTQGTRVIPVILSPCQWRRIPWLEGIQAHPKDGDPLSGMSDHEAEAALSDLAGEIHDQFQSARSARATPLHRDDKGGAPALQVDISRIDRYAPEALIGREAELATIDKAWEQATNQQPQRPHILTFVALGGEGKTSLVAKWAMQQAHNDWPGCEAAFAWSFYSQGTRDQTAASSDTFLKEALRFFGDPKLAESPVGAWDKGKRLAQLVGGRRALLILDGLEPLQYAPTSPTPGELKDQGIAALLKGLAGANLGLCLVTTRYGISDLKGYRQTTAPEIPLPRLSTPAGVDLLQRLGVKGVRKEYETLVEEVKGHALTLQLIGAWLCDAHGGDIRKKDLVRLAEADAEEQGGHAFRVMDAYVQWFQTGGKTLEDRDKGLRALALLRLMGLFDRPADAGCLEALWRGDAVPGLTEPLIGLSEAQRNLALSRLESARLLTVNRDGAGQLISLDTHPLIREYFARQLRKEYKSWQAAHRRIYEHLRDTTKEGDRPSLEALQPLYQAVAHGCWAGLQQDACIKIFEARILRKREHYTWKKLGAFGSDLGAIACFFEAPWNRFSLGLSESDQAWLLNEAAFCLRALGRLTEALDPMRAGMEMAAKQNDRRNAAQGACNLSELKLTVGDLAGAVADAGQASNYTDRSDEWDMRMILSTTHADALHQAGRRSEAMAIFVKSEQLQVEHLPVYPLLHSVQGFRYCDLLMAGAEQAAWRVFVEAGHARGGGAGSAAEDRNQGPPSTLLLTQAEHRTVISGCQTVQKRAARVFEWRKRPSWNLGKDSLLDIALDHLTLGRVTLYRVLLEGADVARDTIRPGDGISPDLAHIDFALTGLRRAGTRHMLPLALFTHAWLRALQGRLFGPDSAESDLNEAQEIAERGPMPLYLADCHLHRARLFRDHLPDRGAGELQQARALIERHGYGRRRGELEDAERAIGLR